MNNFDYTIGWFTDWLDRVCVGKKKIINVHLPCGNNRLKRGKRLFIEMAIEAEKRNTFIRFVVTDGNVDVSPSEDRIAKKTLKEHFRIGENSMLISKNHEVVLQKMDLQGLESRKDLMRDYDIFVIDYTPCGDSDDVVFPFDEYVIQRLPDGGLIIDFRFNTTGKGEIISCLGMLSPNNLTLIHQPTEIYDERDGIAMRYEVWKKEPTED